MGLKVKRLKTSETSILVVMLFLLIINTIKNTPFWVKYFDEAIAVVAIIVLAVKNSTWIKNKESRRIILSLIMLIILGFVYNIAFGIIKVVPAILIDAFGIIKNHVVFITLVFAVSHVRMERIVIIIAPIIKAFIIVVFFCGIINAITDIGMTYYSLRFGLRSYMFLYSNPAMIGITMIVCIGILDYMHYNKIIKYLAFVSMALTFRALVYMMIVIYCVLSFLLCFRKRIKWYHIALMTVIGAAIGWNMVGESYFINKESNRYLLLNGGIQVFLRYFPFGSGFATYGSQMAYTYYSPFYKEFGFLNHWGLNLSNGSTANDNFWPMVMAQFGIAGIVLIGSVLWQEFRIVNTATNDAGRKKAILSIFFSLALSTLASADLTGVAGLIRYFGLGILVNASRERIKKGNFYKKGIKPNAKIAYGKFHI